MRRVKDQDEEGKGPGDQEDPGTRGPRDQGTKGPKDQGTRGPGDQRTKGTRGPGDQRTRGPADQGTKGWGEPEIVFPENLYVCSRVLDFFSNIIPAVWVWSLRSAVCTSFARHFIGGSLGVKFSLFGLYKLCRAFHTGGGLGVKPSLWNLHKLCKAFYRWQFGYEAFALKSAQALQGIL